MKEYQSDIELSIIVPTLNEADNVELLSRRLIDSVKTDFLEIIFVDDSTDSKTREVLKFIQSKEKLIKTIFRQDQIGLSSAVLDGLKECKYKNILVIDADLQHDERIIPNMLDFLYSDHSLDIVIGSRYAEGGDIQSWELIRKIISLTGSTFSRILLRNELRDPLSGFFLIRKDIFDSLSSKLSRSGFKILLDIFISSEKKLKFKEIPYSFRKRHSGKSKLSFSVIKDFYLLFVKKISKASINSY